jgi:hypothetical protein
LRPVRPAAVESPFESDQRAEPNAPPDIGNHSGQRAPVVEKQITGFHGQHQTDSERKLHG